MIPLKLENERVVGENNQLHREIIDVKEQLQSSEIMWRGKDQQNRSELDDCKFVIRQKEIKSKELEELILSLKEQIASGTLTGQGIEMSGALNANPNIGYNVRGGESEAQQWAGELRQADERLTEAR